MVCMQRKNFAMLSKFLAIGQGVYKIIYKIGQFYSREKMDLLA